MQIVLVSSVSWSVVSPTATLHETPWIGVDLLLSHGADSLTKQPLMTERSIRVITSFIEGVGALNETTSRAR